MALAIAMPRSPMPRRPTTTRDQTVCSPAARAMAFWISRAGSKPMARAVSFQAATCRAASGSSSFPR
ncbi:hypothetical protein, partial [Erythrobacter donghaensis]|uniref:hypothetical protein n=1 Tax=Erythrobacter donghaensis TaxID=267135 RepID=UPI001E54B541